MAHILVSGSVAYDHIMNFPDLFRNHFVADKLHNINVSFNVSEHNEHFGGCAGNIAYSLKLLGEKPQILATAGKDFARYEEHLKKDGIDTSSIHRNNEKSTSFAYILTDQGDNQIAGFHLGSGGTPYGADVPLSGARAGIISPGCFDDMAALPGVFRDANIPFFFDPGQVIPSLPLTTLQNGFDRAEVVFGNDYEFSMLSKRLNWTEGDMLRHTKALIVTLGEKGTRIVTNICDEFVPAVPARTLVDPTGAGDAYRAGFIHGYVAGLSLKQCAELGSTSAVYCVEQAGTQAHTYTLEDYIQRFESAYEKYPLRR